MRGVHSTAFALVGDRFHNSDYIRSALGKTLVKEAGLSIDFTDEVTLLSADTLKNYKMLIIFRDAWVWPDGYGIPEIVSDPPLLKKKEFVDVKPQFWMKPSQGKAVKEFVEDGGSIFFFHNSIHLTISNEDLHDIGGCIHTGHPPVRPFKLKITNRKHPITRGVNDFVVMDEQHYVKYEKDPEYVFMRSENENGLTYTGWYGGMGDQGTSCEAGWAYEYGKGRVCFMAPGHIFYVLCNPEYEKLQKNAVKWLLRE